VWARCLRDDCVCEMFMFIFGESAIFCFVWCGRNYLCDGGVRTLFGSTVFCGGIRGVIVCECVRVQVGVGVML
jgi:hypothetical protein